MLKKEKFIITLYILGMLFPVFLIFRYLFLPGALVWGDAPFYYPVELIELTKVPFAWTNRFVNFGGINVFLWIHPLMRLYGLFHKLFQFNNDLIIRIVFFFPSLFFSIFSPLLFTKHLKLDRKVQFFSSFVYTINTYYILLIDGGVVGVALAYSIFPLVLLQLYKLVQKHTLGNFLKALVAICILALIDPRVLAICLSTLLVWKLFESVANRSFREIKSISYILPLLILLLGLNQYWIYSLIRLENINLSLDVAGLQLVGLINPIFLFQPHWPDNVFGKVSYPPFYFVVIPLFILLSQLKRDKKKKLSVFFALFLTFSFLAKGTSPPLGNFYKFIIESIPLGSVFRDSSKFFIPVCLFSGILVGEGFVYLSKKLKKIPVIVTSLIVYGSLVILVSPAILGKLNWVLSARKHPEEIEIISKYIDQESGFFRTAWFPEKYPASINTEAKPSLDAKSLVNLRPFAVFNVGSYDHFNFMHNKYFPDLLDLFGIKYLIFSNDPRKLTFSENETKDWENLLNLVGGTDGVAKLGLDINMPVYQVRSSKPRIFAQQLLLMIVGSDDFYKTVWDNNLSLSNQGITFVEDGLFNPEVLSLLPQESTVLVFNNKQKIDLTMSLLSSYFISSETSSNSDWIYWPETEYLKWKFELLVHDIETYEFDYREGIAFSSQEEEKISFNFNIDSKNKYTLALRSMTSADGGKMQVTLDNYSFEVINSKDGSFEWSIFEKLELDKGKHLLEIKNVKGSHVLNLVALVPEDVFKNSLQKTEELLNSFDSYDLSLTSELDSLINLLGKQTWQGIEYTQISPVEYSVLVPEDANWLIFSDSYNPSWKLENGEESIAAYSSLNAFFSPREGKNSIYFRDQKYINTGFLITLATAIISIIIVLVWKYGNDRKG